VKIRTVALRHEGGQRFVGKTGTGRSIVFGEAVSGNEYSPVESVVASLAACTAMDVISILGKKRQAIDRYEVEARAEQRTEYPQVLTLIDVTHVVEGTVLLEEAVRRAIELSATKYCPVNAMLSSGATEVHHRFRMRCTGLEPKEAEGEVIVTGPFRPPNVVPGRVGPSVPSA
jgi:putative redox protein